MNPQRNTRLALLFATLILAFLTAPLLAQSVIVDDITDDQIYKIRSVHETSKCIDITNASLSTEALARIETCDDGTSQRWKLINNDDDLFSMVAIHSGKCLDVKASHAGQTNGRNVQQYPCHGGSNQLWEIVPDGSHVEFIVDHSNKCLHASQGQGSLIRPFRREGLLEQWDCDNDDWQKWLLTVVATCQNSICESSEGESHSNCPEDCPAVCPNGLCESGETCSSCWQDCGTCPPPPTCDPVECNIECGGAGECAGNECVCI